MHRYSFALQAYGERTIEERNILAGQVFEKVIENAALEKWGVMTRDAIKEASDEATLNAISIEIPNLGV